MNRHTTLSVTDTLVYETRLQSTPNEIGMRMWGVCFVWCAWEVSERRSGTNPAMMGRETRDFAVSYRCAPATVVRTFVTLAVPCDQDGSILWGLCRYVYTLSSYHGPLRLSRATPLRDPAVLKYNPLCENWPLLTRRATPYGCTSQLHQCVLYHRRGPVNQSQPGSGNHNPFGCGCVSCG